MHVSVQLSYRRIRRYLVLPPKEAEKHVTSSHVRFTILLLNYNRRKTQAERYRKYEKEPWKSRGLHVLPVDNYVVLYISDSNKKVVTILRVMYAGRDIDNQLNLHTKQ